MRRAGEQESRLDGDHQAVPLSRGHSEIVQVLNTTGDAFVFDGTVAAEKDGAGITGANQLPGRSIDQMLVFDRQLRTGNISQVLRLSSLARANCRRLAKD